MNNQDPVPIGGTLRMNTGPNRYRTPVERMPDVFTYHRIVINGDGQPVDYVFLAVNPSFAEIIGLSEDQVIGKNVTELYPGNEKSEFDWIGGYGRVALSGETIRFANFFPQKQAAGTISRPTLTSHVTWQRCFEP